MTSEPGRRVVINRFGQSQSQKRRKHIKCYCYDCSAFALKEANRLDTSHPKDPLYLHSRIISDSPFLVKKKLQQMLGLVEQGNLVMANSSS